MKSIRFYTQPRAHSARLLQVARVRVISILFSICSLILLVPPVENHGIANSQVAATAANLLVNGGLEDGYYFPDGSPTGWTHEAYNPQAVFTWDNTQAHTGSHSVKITGPVPSDASWIQTVNVQPDTLYVLSGWIKTENVAHTDQLVDAGANLCLYGTWTRTPGLFGTNNWTYVSMLVNSGSATQLTVGARLGYWAGVAGGTVWFDDLELREVTSEGPHPQWKILVLIYGQTDFTYTDPQAVQHRFVASMSDYEKGQAAIAATKFVTEDIPALTSGNMVPLLTIRYPARPLTQLDSFAIGQGWWPSPANTAADRDPAFDSVIVIWDPRCMDQTTGSYVWIGGGGAAGLTPGMGTGQTYCANIIESAVYYGHRNVFKHEWGHSILSYFDASGAAPKPAVTNHAYAGQYVHWPTGDLYVWLDETDLNPIPNSIYNNGSGFTHDYYSGSTATADQPSRRLGVTPVAWATGGPVSKTVFSPPPTPEQQLQSVRDRISELVIQGALDHGLGTALQAKLDGAARALSKDQKKAAANKLGAFINQVQALVKTGRLDVMNAQYLTGTASKVISQISAG
jgi:hypothetical protein